MNKIFHAIFILAFTFHTYQGMSQHIKSDFELLEAQSFEKSEFKERKVKFGITENKNIIVRYNPVSLALGSLMYGYQKFISPQFSSTCLYSPSCSAYSKALIKQFGLIKGVACTADRLMRCNRLTASQIRRQDVDKHDHKVHEHTDRYRFKSVSGH